MNTQKLITIFLFLFQPLFAKNDRIVSYKAENGQFEVFLERSTPVEPKRSIWIELEGNKERILCGVSPEWHGIKPILRGNPR